MLRSFLYLLKLALFWLIFFTLYRICFLLIYPGRTPQGQLSEALLVFVWSIRLDASAITYLMLFPIILWAVQQFIKKNILNRINHYYNILLISLSTLLCVSNIATYQDWNTLINYNTLYYLLAPAKIFPYMTTIELIAVSIGVTAIIALFVLLFRLMILPVIPYSTSKTIHKAILVPFIFPIALFVMRGGLQKKPISEKFVCYSETKFFNHVCVNPVWYLGHMALLEISEGKIKSYDEFFKWE